MSFAVWTAESRALNGEAGGVVRMRVSGRGGRAAVPGEVRCARDVLRHFLGMRDRGVADVVGAQVLSLVGR